MAQPNTMWDRMTPDERLKAAGIDVMNHPQFGLLAGFVVMGTVKFDPRFPTAATDGINEYYGVKFMAAQNRKQTRYLRIHENWHKALRHCSDYNDVCAKYPSESNQAMDYVINGFIEEADPKHEFVEHPALVKPLLDPKFYGMSFVEVLQHLLKNPPPPPPPPPPRGKGKGKGPGVPGGGGGGGDPEDEEGGGNEFGTLDEHLSIPEGTDLAKHGQRVEDAARQGRMVVEKLIGRGKGGHALDAIVQDQRTNWRDPMREFIVTLCEGDDMSRFCPPNRRLQPLGVLMPSHFSETTGEIIVACDTSGSMGGVYPVVFGEVANFVRQAPPEKLRLLWWDTEVCGEQVFLPHEYDRIAHALQPKGGGGTHPGAVVDYIRKHNLKPKAVIWLTDGYLDDEAVDAGCPQLWGVVDNESFRPAKGKVIHISSVRL